MSSPFALVLWGVASVIGTATFSNGLVAFLLRMGWPRAASIAAGALPFVVHAIHVGGDALGAAKGDRIRVIARDLASWAEEKDAPEVIKFVAKLNAEVPPVAASSVAPPLIVAMLAIVLLAVGCDGSMIPPKTAKAIEAVAESGPLLEGCQKGAEKTCEALTDPAERKKCLDGTATGFSDLLSAVEVAKRIWEAVRP